MVYVCRSDVTAPSFVMANAPVWPGLGLCGGSPLQTVSLPHKHSLPCYNLAIVRSQYCLLGFVETISTRNARLIECRLVT